MNQHEDVVIEVKVRLAGLSYDEAKRLRDFLRTPGDIGMREIVNELLTGAQEVAPGANVTAYAPWCEWRPAQGKRRNPQ